MQNSGGVPGVAQILDRHERGSQLRRFVKIAARASLEQLPAESWRKAAGTCREAGQILQERVLRWIVPHYRVLDPDAKAIINQSRDDIQAGFFVRAEIVFVFEIENEFRIGGPGDLPVTALQAHVVSWIAARQHHHARELKLAQQVRLIHRPPERWSDTRNYPEFFIEARKPLDQLFIISQRDVIQECIAAINQSRNAAAYEVAGDQIVLRKVYRAGDVAVSRERRHGEYSTQIVGRN